MTEIARFPGTETLAFALRLRPGTEAEYQRRHDTIWPDMRDALLASGILHYEIHLCREESLLFAFIIRSTSHSMDSLPDNPVWQRWQAHMGDILVGTPARIPLELMFSLSR